MNTCIERWSSSLSVEPIAHKTNIYELQLRSKILEGVDIGPYQQN